MTKKLLKTAGVGLAAVILTTLGIQASDVVTGVEGRLSSLVRESGGPCAGNEKLVRYGAYALCVDMYEASPHDNCPIPNPQSEVDTLANIATTCVPVTRPEVMPWRFVSYTQAKQLCARAGKRLPDASEWYQLAVGMTELSSCNLYSRTGQSRETGNSACVTPTGIYDLVGNVWEWMDDTVTDGRYDERTLPASGYVALVDGDGVVIETIAIPQVDFGVDYAWTSADGVRGFLRGGFYGSGNDGGIFSQNTSVSLDFATAGVGFRCVRDVL